MILQNLKAKSKTKSKVKAKEKVKVKAKVKAKVKDKEKIKDTGKEYKQMEQIVNQLELTKGVSININIYGYGTKSNKSNRLMSDHLKVYEDIVKIVKMEDVKQRKNYVSKLTTNKLRDIKSKIGSGGKTGKKQEMVNGIIKELPKLVKNYRNNEQNDIEDKDNQSDNQSDIEIKENNDPVCNNSHNDKQENDDDDDDEHNSIEIDINKETVSDADDENDSEEEATLIPDKLTRRFKRRNKRITHHESDSDVESQIDSDSEYLQPSYTDSDRLHDYFREKSLNKNTKKKKNSKGNG